MFKDLKFKVFVILSCCFFCDNFFPRKEVSKNLLCACFFEIISEIFNWVGGRGEGGGGGLIHKSLDVHSLQKGGGFLKMDACGQGG